MIKTRNTFSNYAPGYADSQLVKLRLLRHRLYPEWKTQNDRNREAALATMTFDDYVKQQRVAS